MHYNSYTFSQTSPFVFLSELLHRHTHHLNGVEFKHRHIVELDITLLNRAVLPLFWDQAFLTSDYIINRLLPIAALNFVMSYTNLFHQPPYYNFIEEFGSSFLVFFFFTVCLIT